MARSGEVFLLEMGEAVRIIALAETMIRLSGLTVRNEGNPDGDIEIRETGLRPGEKLFEELLIDSSAQPTAHARIYSAEEEMLPWGELEANLRSEEHTSELQSLMRNSYAVFCLNKKKKDFNTIT